MSFWQNAVSHATAWPFLPHGESGFIRRAAFPLVYYQSCVLRNKTVAASIGFQLASLDKTYSFKEHAQTKHVGKETLFNSAAVILEDWKFNTSAQMNMKFSRMLAAGIN